MNLSRRSFFQSLGAAVLGTAIALKIPDSLLPQIGVAEGPKAVPVPTFAQLNELYDKCKLYGEEPSYMMFSKDMLEAVKEEMSHVCNYVSLDNSTFVQYKFRNARMGAYSFYSDEQVSCGGGTKYGSQGRLNLITGKII